MADRCYAPRRRASARTFVVVALLVGVLGTAGLVAGGPTASAAGDVRGFDGTTIVTAGMGPAASFTGAEVGTKARYERANKTNEVKGVKFKFAEFADDKSDPASAISEARRLVTQENVFAIVPLLSTVTPGTYLVQQHVPSFGWGFDPNAYCSKTPSTALWAFGFTGCTGPVGNKVSDTFTSAYKYASELTGKKHPTAVVVSNENPAGQGAVDNGAASLKGAGFKIVWAKANVPEQVSDYAPYIKDWLTADDGNQPDFFYALFSVQSLAVVDALNANGFEGTIETGLYSDLVVKPLEGTLTGSSYNTAPNKGLTQMQEDVEAVAPGTKVTSLNAAAYFAADMFIQAVKTAAKQGKANITPEAVQKAASVQTWEIPGLVGPTIYPASTQVAKKSCSTLLKSDGTTWNIVAPFTCSAKTFRK